MKSTRVKGILSSGLIYGVMVLGKALQEAHAGGFVHEMRILVAIWYIGVITVAPFWFLFEAIVEKIKEEVE